MGESDDKEVLMGLSLNDCIAISVCFVIGVALMGLGICVYKRHRKVGDNISETSSDYSVDKDDTAILKKPKVERVTVGEHSSAPPAPPDIDIPRNHSNFDSKLGTSLEATACASPRSYHIEIQNVPTLLRE